MSGKRSKQMRKESRRNMQAQTININRNDLMGFKSATCESCSGEYFHKIHIKKVLPAVHPINQTGREGVINIEMEACIKCGHIIGDKIVESKAPEKPEILESYKERIV